MTKEDEQHEAAEGGQQKQAEQKKSANSGKPDKKPHDNDKEQGLWPVLRDMLVKFHAHPISVHTPNGVFPFTVLLLLLAVIFSSEVLSLASLATLIYVVVFMPLVLFSGYVDWKANFRGYVSKVFEKKISSGFAAAAVSLVLLTWRVIDPEVITRGFLSMGLYVLVHLVCLAFIIYAGFLGGKLVFKR